uniref:Uncharacterized protein n=1 Tax=Ulva sp. UNA00071828 TaxID=1641711 RepID=A0A0F6WVX0_9CHLO|nr:hypothetical protein [Ulva sp. UNA00071828]
MNYKQRVLNNNSNIRKHNFSITALEASKGVSKHYKAIDFSLVGNGVKSTAQNKKEISYIRPLRIVVLQFHTIENYNDSYSIDVSCFFNKPLKTVILKYSKRTKISKKFARWIKSDPTYSVLKNNYKGGLNINNNIVGSDINMHEYELYIDLHLKSIPLTKSRISYTIAQTLCKTQHINKSLKASYTEQAGVIGAFILKNNDRDKGNTPMLGYYISEYELKQCALANFTKKQTIEVTQWPHCIKINKTNEAVGKYNSLLGGITTKNELVRSSTPAGSGGPLVKRFQTVASIGTLSSLKRPLHTLVNLLTKIGTPPLL